MNDPIVPENDIYFSIESLKKEPIWLASNPEKRPVSVITNKPAQWKKSEQLATFEQVHFYINGRENFYPAFVLKEEHGIVFIDLDDCYEGDSLNPIAQEVLSQTGGSFAEKSRSGKGVHVLTGGTIPKCCKTSDIEMYCDNKVVTLTFDLINERQEIESHEEFVASLFEQHAPKPKEKRKTSNKPPPNRSKEEILAKIKLSTHHWELYENGFTEKAKQNYKKDKSQSTADFDFMCFLAKQTENTDLAVEIFKESKLWNEQRSKKKSGETYLRRTFEKACETVEVNEESNRIPWESYYFLDLWKDNKLWVYYQPALSQKTVKEVFKDFNMEDMKGWDYDTLKKEMEGSHAFFPNAMAVSSVIEKVGIVRDGKSNHHHLLVRFPSYEDGKVHELAIPSGSLHTDKNKVINDLSSHGLYIRHERDKELIGYLLDKRPLTKGLVVDKIGWHDDLYILPNEQFGVLRGDHSLIHLKKEKLTQVEFLETRGTLEEWQENLGRYIKNNPSLIFTTGVAFAPVLMNDLGVESGGFNFYGSSSVGKTSAVMVANSIWASPNWKNTWRSTDNALEGLCCSHNDAFMALDELGQATSEVVGKSSYMIANETAKLRANRHGDMTEVKKWRTLFVSTGEESVEQKIKEFSNKVKAGQLIRVLDIPVAFEDSVEGEDGNRAFYHDLHEFSSLDTFSKNLYAQINHYYGTPIRAFLGRYIDQRTPDSLKELKEEYRLCQELLEGHCRKNHGEVESQTSRAISRFALVLLASKKAMEFGLLPMRYEHEEEKNQPLFAVTKVFDLWMKGRGGSGGIEEKQILKKLSVFFSQHGQTNKFIDFDTRQEDIPNNTSGVHGYRKITGEEEGEKSMCWYITPNMMEEICANLNENYRSVRKVLRDHGMLQLGSTDQAMKKPRDTLIATPKSLRKKNRYLVITDKVLEN